MWGKKGVPPRHPLPLERKSKHSEYVRTNTRVGGSSKYVRTCELTRRDYDCEIGRRATIGTEGWYF